MPWPEKWLLVRAWWLLLGVWVALRTLPFPRVRRFGRVAVGRPRRAPSTPIERVGWCVRAAGRLHLAPMTCLPRSLVQQRLLRRQGVPAELRIGVQKTDGAIAAHAWLERDGQPINEPESVMESFLALGDASRREG